MTFGGKIGPSRHLVFCRISGVTFGDAQYPTHSDPRPTLIENLAIRIRPNPIEDQLARVGFTLAAGSVVRMEVVDVLGRVAVTRYEVLGPGRHDVPLDVGRLSTGVYTLRLSAGASSGVAPLVVH